MRSWKTLQHWFMLLVIACFSRLQGLLENALPSTGDLSPSSSDSDNTDHTQHKKPHAHHRRLSSSSSSVSQRLPPVSGHRIPEAQPSKSGTMTKTSFSTLLLHEAFFHVDVDMMNLASTLPSNISTASASASGNENASISQKVPTDIEASRQHKRSLGIDSTVSTAVGNQSEEVHFAHSPDVRAAVRTARNDQSNNRGHRIVIQQVRIPCPMLPHRVSKVHRTCAICPVHRA